MPTMIQHSSKSRLLAVGALAASMLVVGGCATKKYVRQQTQPLINHVNQLDAETAKNTNQIRQVQQSSEQGLQAANAKSEQATQQAQQAQNAAQEASQQLGQTSHQIQALDRTIADLDQYKQSSEATVHFGFNKWNLTPQSKQTLDGVLSQLQQDPHSILEVEGFTDSSGPAAYNLKLSQWRADSVVRYLQQNKLALHRIYLIGLGENEAVASNHTLHGRQQNRRVELKVLTNNLAQASSATSGAGSQPAGNSAQ